MAQFFRIGTNAVALGKTGAVSVRWAPSDVRWLAAHDAGFVATVQQVNGWCRVQNECPGAERVLLERPVSECTVLGVTPQVIVTCDSKQRLLRIVKLATAEEVEIECGRVHHVAIASGGNHILTTVEDATDHTLAIIVWSIEGKPTMKWHVSTGLETITRLSMRGNTLATQGRVRGDETLNHFFMAQFRKLSTVKASHAASAGHHLLGISVDGIPVIMTHDPPVNHERFMVATVEAHAEESYLSSDGLAVLNPALGRFWRLFTGAGLSVGKPITVAS